jgi:bifunctional DNase/RNase
LAVHLGAPVYVAEAVLDRAENLAEGERAEAQSARERGDDAGAIARDTQDRLAREAERYSQKGRAA